MADPQAFLDTLEGAADTIVNEKRALFPGRYPPDYRERGVERTLATYSNLTDEMGDMRRAIFGTFAFLLNSVSGLDKKARLDLHVIYATPDETAGDRMHSFAGFFSHQWRLHDYRLGRRTANAKLRWILEGQDDAYEREPNVVYDSPHLGDVHMGNAPRPPREQLREAILKKVHELTEDLGLGPKWVRWATGPIVRWFLKRVVKSKLNTMLRL